MRDWLSRTMRTNFLVVLGESFSDDQNCGAIVESSSHYAIFKIPDSGAQIALSFVCYFAFMFDQCD